MSGLRSALLVEYQGLHGCPSAALKEPATHGRHVFPSASVPFSHGRHELWSSLGIEPVSHVVQAAAPLLEIVLLLHGVHDAAPSSE